MTSPSRRKHQTTRWNLLARVPNLLLHSALAAVLLQGSWAQASDGPSPSVRWKTSSKSATSAAHTTANTSSTLKQNTNLRWRPARPTRGQASRIDTRTTRRAATPTAAYQEERQPAAPRRDPFELDAPQPTRQLPEGTPPTTRQPAADPFDLDRPAPPARTNPVRPAPTDPPATTDQPVRPTTPAQTPEPPRTLDPAPSQPTRNPFPDDPRPTDPQPTPRDPGADDPYYSHTQADCDEAAAILKGDRLIGWAKSRLDIHVTGKEGDDFPLECRFEEQQFVPRSWSETTYFWTASSLCHKPLYFEDAQLERYGHETGPFTQPIVSAAHFFVTLPILPYKMGLRTPNECVYALGHYRPGNCAPYMIEPLGFTWRAALFEAGAWTGAAAAIP